MSETITNWGNTNPKNKKDKEPRPNLVAQMAADIDTEREETQRDEETTNRVGEEQPSASATAPEASASGNTTTPAKSKDKRTKLTDQGLIQLVINDSFKKHTMTVYEPLYQLMTTMAKAWNTNIQDVAALVMMEGVRDLKGKDISKLNKLLKNFGSADNKKEIEEMRTAYLREQTAVLLAQAGLTPDDLKALANGKS